MQTTGTRAERNWPKLFRLPKNRQFGKFLLHKALSAFSCFIFAFEIKNIDSTTSFAQCSTNITSKPISTFAPAFQQVQVGPNLRSKRYGG